MQMPHSISSETGSDAMMAGAVAVFAVCAVSTFVIFAVAVCIFAIFAVAISDGQGRTVDKSRQIRQKKFTKVNISDDRDQATEIR